MRSIIDCRIYLQVSLFVLLSCLVLQASSREPQSCTYHLRLMMDRLADIINDANDRQIIDEVSAGALRLFSKCSSAEDYVYSTTRATEFTTPCDTLLEQYEAAVKARLPISIQYMRFYNDCMFGLANTSQQTIDKMTKAIEDLQQNLDALTLNEKVLNLRIQQLENYVMNVDYNLFAIPSELKYLFVKSTGALEYTENNPPVDKTAQQDSSFYWPLTIPRGVKYIYEGELVNGKPGGFGTIKYGELKGVDNKLYLCTYSGMFMNGMKHGSGYLSVKGGLEWACRYDQHYSYNKKEGIFVINYEIGHQLSHVYQADKRQHVTKEVWSDGTNTWWDMRDDLYHGNGVRFWARDCKVQQWSYLYGQFVQNSTKDFKRLEEIKK